MLFRSSDPAFRQTLKEEYAAFWTAYQQDRDLLRFHYHRPVSYTHLDVYKRQYLFTPPREVVGKCPRCGGEVAELQKGFVWQNDSCKFAIWKNNKWWAAKKKQPTKAVVSALLNDGCVRVTGLYSEKTGKTYDATVVLEDDGQLSLIHI